MSVTYIVFTRNQNNTKFNAFHVENVKKNLYSSKVTLRTYTRKRPLVAILATPGDGSTACLRNDIKVLSSLGDINQLNRPLDRTLPIGRADGVLRVYKKKPRLSTGEQAIRVPSSK